MLEDACSKLTPPYDGDREADHDYDGHDHDHAQHQYNYHEFEDFKNNYCPLRLLPIHFDQLGSDLTVISREFECT